MQHALSLATILGRSLGDVVKGAEVGSEGMLHDHGAEEKEGLIDGTIGAKGAYDLAVGVDGEHRRALGRVLQCSQHGQSTVDSTKSIVSGTRAIAQSAGDTSIAQSRGDGVSLLGHVLQNLSSRLRRTGPMKTVGGTSLEDGNVGFLGDALFGSYMPFLELFETASCRLPLPIGSQLVGLLDE